MKAALLYGVKDLRLEEVDIPEVGPGEILARVRAATTCGTDLKIYKRGYVGGIIKYPQPFGHEWAGDVVKVGEGVQGIEEGIRIRAGNSTPCYKCPMCQKGLYNLCENRTWLWGSYAEYVKVPAPIVKHNLHIIPPNLSYAEAAITEPLACVLHGVLKAGIKLGDTVVVIGAGPIGILHTQLAKRMGAKKVIIGDLVEERLKIAEKLGADVTINVSEEDITSRVKEETGGLGADVVIEAVGLPTTWQKALELVAKGGTVLEFGGCPPGTKIEVDTELLHYSEVTLLGTFHATPEEFSKAFDLISSGQINVKPIISMEKPLEEIKEVFDSILQSKKVLKVSITP
ncbi:MAG: alcohol dehydrogenase [Thermoproteota archaeon]|nr:MAG: alcohol dehydrogenase [Candidatus Korarchaeota archaeon]